MRETPSGASNLCQGCVTALTTPVGVTTDTITVTKDGLVAWLTTGRKFRVVDSTGKSCEFEVDSTPTTDTTVTVKKTNSAGVAHGCTAFTAATPAENRPLVVTDLCVGNACVKSYNSKTKTLTFATGVDLTTYLVPGVNFYVHRRTSPTHTMHDETGCTMRVASTAWDASTGVFTVTVDSPDYPYPASVHPLAHAQAAGDEEMPSKHSCESFTADAALTLLGAEYTLGGLQEGTNYFVRVRAANRVGFGEAASTEPPSATPRDAPGAVTSPNGPLPTPLPTLVTRLEL